MAHRANCLLYAREQGTANDAVANIHFMDARNGAQFMDIDVVDTMPGVNRQFQVVCKCSSIQQFEEFLISPFAVVCVGICARV